MGVKNGGVSNRVPSVDKKDRLKSILNDILNIGFISERMGERSQSITHNIIAILQHTNCNEIILFTRT